ncbi:MAG: sigma-70 family RNA polymerase sigma factor [Bacteroidales bacterium]|nr:sigma-70 family RNA polymerase sigma factor [Bacteroidales bacterium]MBR0304032.1 sigma-70 family RNA polymerase sigma factor [Bacteroidales bacterium]MBR0539557.1 sigma-70 family RNA polymerase sigma factor [Bacteroidales bacterium]
MATTIQEIEELIAGCQNNNRDAQRRLYEKFASTMLGVCMRYANSKEEAEDVMMDGFMGVFKNISTYRGESSLDSWIRSIMVKTAISHFRAEKKHLMNDSLDDKEDSLMPISEREESIVTRLEAKQVLEIVAKMPEDLRVIFNLRLVEEYSFKEIAEELEKNENTVRVYYQRARKWLIDRII